MFRPVLVTAATMLPVSLEDVKTALRVDGADSDAEITRLIRSAVAHYEGWAGVLGISLVAQTWRQDYAHFEQKMDLSVGPVGSVAEIRYRNEAGQLTTVDASHYALKLDGGGRAYVRFANSYSAPTNLYEDAPVSIEYVAGWPLTEGEDPQPTTPADIRTAIIMRVQKHFDEAAKINADILDRVERDLIAKYRTPL